MTDPLHEYDEAVLRMIGEPNRGTDQTGRFRAKSDLDEEFGEDSPRLAQAIQALMKRKYIKDIEAVLAAIGDTAIDYEAYQLTALGANYLAKSSSQSTTFNNISHSNIANNSSNVSQSININEQPKDIQEKYIELQNAMSKKDPSAMKRAFGYIADKSIDVAVAIAAGVLLK